MDSKQTSKKQTRELCLRALSDDDLWKIWDSIRKREKTTSRILPKGGIRHFFETAAKSHFFLYLGLIIGGDVGERGNYRFVLENFAALKKKLKKLPFPKDVLRAGKVVRLVPEKPSGLCLYHPSIGRAVPTNHAWQRFCTRYLIAVGRPQKPQYFSADYFCQAMRECFFRSKLKDLVGFQGFERMIRHREKAASYFYDKVTDLRFIVKSEKPPIILTVELPAEIPKENRA